MKQLLRYACAVLAVTTMASVAVAGLPLPPPPPAPPGLPAPPKLPPPPGVEFSGPAAPVKVKAGKKHNKKKHRKSSHNNTIQIKVGR